MAAPSSTPVARIPLGLSCPCAGAPATISPTNSRKATCRRTMSTKNPIDLRQDRRQCLRTSATVLGATLLPLPAVAAQTQQAEAAPATPETKPTGAKSAARFFTPAQHALVDELSETIIPADSHSGGAKAAKVADYIDQALGESLDEEEKAMWHEGMRLVDLMCHHFHGKPFVNASGEERIEVL